MAVQLFRQGRTHEVRGIKCEMQTFSEFNFINMLDVGWFLSPEEAYAEPPPVEVEPLETVTEQPAKKSRKKRAKKAKK